MNQVQAWVADRLHTLGISTGQSVRALDWSDDRLGIVLDEVSDPDQWQAFERDLNRRTLRVYRPHRTGAARASSGPAPPAHAIEADWLAGLVPR